MYLEINNIYFDVTHIYELFVSQIIAKHFFL